MFQGQMQVMWNEGSNSCLSQCLWAGSVTLSVSILTLNRKRKKIRSALGDGYCSMADVYFSPFSPYFLISINNHRERHVQNGGLWNKWLKNIPKAFIVKMSTTNKKTWSEREKMCRWMTCKLTPTVPNQFFPTQIVHGLVHILCLFRMLTL